MLRTKTNLNIRWAFGGLSYLIKGHCSCWFFPFRFWRPMPYLAGHGLSNYSSYHRVGRVLRFFTSRRNWDFPHPSPAGECAPPPRFWGEGHTRWRERGWESPNSDEGTYTVVLFIYIYTYFVVVIVLLSFLLLLVSLFLLASLLLPMPLLMPAWMPLVASLLLNILLHTTFLINVK